MSHRERVLKTLKHELPDMVPCCPDISIMVPLKMKKRPFWEYYIDEEKNYFWDVFDNENLLRAYIDICKYFGIPAFCWYVQPKIVQEDIEYKYEILEKRSDRIVGRTTMITPEGELWSETVYPIDNPPFPVRKYIKDFKKQFKFLKYFIPTLDNVDFNPVIKEKEFVGNLGTISISVPCPSLVDLDYFVDGGLGTIGMIYYDYPDLIAEYKRMREEWSVVYLKKIIKAKCCDEILTGGSGLMTWQSPKITRELSLKGLQEITKICKENNIISRVHCCGFEKELVKMCAEETDLDAIEPLEGPPQGDCNLREIKLKYGKKLVLKGNLSTSSIMLADVKTVEAAAIKAIEDTAEDGGFILSSGDQCGRDTPHENIFKLVEVCEKYGKY